MTTSPPLPGPASSLSGAASGLPGAASSLPLARLADLVDTVDGSAQLSERRIPLPYPRIGDSRWRGVAEAHRLDVISTARALLQHPWPQLLASDFARYALDGDRSHYEQLYFGRRTRLVASTLAAVLTGEEAWLRDAVDGLMLICEETTWAIPAHATRAQQRGSALARPDDLDLDLFCAETGGLLAWVDYLIGDRLDDLSQTIRPRVADELRTRVLEPFLQHRDWRWLVEFTNNWNPWIHSGVLAVALLTEIDPQQRRQVIGRALEGLDRFLDSCPADGGCDEGATYWGRAGGSLGDCLSLLYDATRGAVDGFGHPKVAALARYLPAMHIDDQWLVSFADGSARLTDRTMAEPLYRLGRHTDQPVVVRQALAIERQLARTEPLVRQLSSIGRVVGCLLRPRDDQADTFPYLGELWFPDTQVLVARQLPGSPEGIYLAVKGGHNDESHNHNDIGNFVVAVDGRPMIIDMGAGTYTRQTFGPDRYEIFTMQSGFHNVPEINGQPQQAGPEFRADAMAVEIGRDQVRCSIELAAAYPAGAGARSWRRQLVLARESTDAGLEVTDSWDLATGPASLVWHLITPAEVSSAPGLVRLRLPGPGRELEIGYDQELVTCAEEPVPLADPKLASVWTSGLTRLTLTATQPLLQRTGALRLRLRSRPAG
ncbi:heparinase II/III family protein [Microlunatus panaciterrae]|uniref:Heparinase II/III-like C-terminal domain-containing protein n=1 Tax=Microlunatus panaciterrae TaxID=400768 RepID=A0ABS2RJU4_9ACTN|nr:heparinase II/III family protein [Microlunatus panaciterrae]MBM7798837.1 hypothetical protein [Microlunatus panaciterrae]